MLGLENPVSIRTASASNGKKNRTETRVLYKITKSYKGINSWSIDSMKARLLVKGEEDFGENCSTTR